VDLDGPQEAVAYNRTIPGTDAATAVFSLENMSRSCVVSSANQRSSVGNLLQIHCAQSAQERRNGSVRVTDQAGNTAAQFPDAVANTNPSSANMLLIWFDFAVARG